jgi:tetratricopeptide (TPR) repeat protein
MESVASILERSQLALDLSKIDEARELANRVLTLDPDNYAALCALARCELRVGNDKKAEELARAASAQNSDDGYFLLSLAFEIQVKWDEAEKAIRKAIELNPDAPSYQIALSRVLTERMEGKSAEEIVDKVLAKSPQDNDARLIKAYHLSSRGDDDEAEKLLLDILSEHPEHNAALNNLAVLRHSQGRFVEAEKLLWQALVHFTDTHGELARSNLLTVARTRFLPTDWWQRLHIVLWRAIRLRNPFPRIREMSSAESGRTVLALLMGGVFVSIVLWAPEAAWLLILAGYATHPFSNLVLSRESRYQNIIGRSGVKRSLFLILGWSGFLLIPLFGPGDPREMWLSTILPVFFNYAMSVQSRGDASSAFYYKLARIQLVLLGPAVLLLLLSSVFQIKLLLLCATYLTVGILALAMPVFVIAFIEVIAAFLAFFPLQPILFE